MERLRRENDRIVNEEMPTNAAEIQRRFPQFRLPGDYTAVLEQAAGFLFVENCVRAHIDASRSLPASVALSVNLSPAAIIDGRVCETIRTAGGEGLIVEITEHAIVQDYDRLLMALGDLRRCGVQVAIDDAGAGFSSLQHVVQLSPDILKLDMSLTRDIDRDPVRRALATSLTAFTQEMNIELIAEGVETPGELITLQAIGAHAAQGYLLAKPGELTPQMTGSIAQELAASRGPTPRMMKSVRSDDTSSTSSPSGGEMA